MFVFELPEIGEGVVEGEIVKWLVQAGEPIAVDQPVCEIMTDKATVEISSPRGGRIVRLYGEEGDVIPVHTPLVDIDETGSATTAAPTAAPAPAAASAAAAAGPARTPAPAPVAAPVAAAPAPAVLAERVGGKTLATPAVRSHARDLGVDIDRVAGTGRSGRVTRADLDRAAVSEPVSAVAPPAVPQPAPVVGREDERIRIIGLRRKIAEKMAESYRLVPHFTYVDEVDATALVALRKALKPAATERGVKLTYLPFIMKALVSAFRAYPTVNANMDEERFELIVRGSVNIGIATDSPQGLYVPVVKNVEQKSILELAAEIADLTERTRKGRVQASELQGGSFTITSVGNIGGRFATPIINHPEVAILGVNQIHKRPVVVDDQVVVREMMYLSPSFDHRVIDGAVAARFTTHLKATLERPETLMLELR
ncbi:MAG: pyruvate dehydrogenase E2 component (dihydrolipoamide acetyltransferase) [Myxococcota bacterium]|jgi:pyruvate dehydrogenase E2 component (dihydrolipoamide acetyltransferase)